MTIESFLITVSVWIVPVLLAVTLHEAAHGWAAWKLGDDTAWRMGRVTFNPLRHIDPMGTVILPALLLLASGGQMMFGFAKPVPVAFHALRHFRRDMVLVAAAGPGTNLLLALASAGLGHVLPLLPGGFLQGWLAANILNSVWINCLLAVFNMIPLPPLDGGRVAVGALPPFLGRHLARLERTGIVILLLALFALPWLGHRIGLDLDVFPWLVGAPAEYLSGLVFLAMGMR
ncbi:MAG: site-2 protease family protein [Magnetospirillum sp. WYHS-4]